MKIDVNKIRADGKRLEREVQARVGWLATMGIPEDQLEAEAVRLVALGAVDDEPLRNTANRFAAVLARHKMRKAFEAKVDCGKKS